MSKSIQARGFVGDWIVGGLFLLFCLRIPINGLVAHNGRLLINLAVISPLPLLTIPMMMSFKWGVILQLALQCLILSGPLIFGNQADAPQFVAAAMICYCVVRLSSLLGPPLLLIRRGTKGA